MEKITQGCQKEKFLKRVEIDEQKNRVKLRRKFNLIRGHLGEYFAYVGKSSPRVIEAVAFLH